MFICSRRCQYGRSRIVSGNRNYRNIAAAGLVLYRFRQRSYGCSGKHDGGKVIFVQFDGRKQVGIEFTSVWINQL
jgi:hypothetical protein